MQGIPVGPPNYMHLYVCLCLSQALFLLLHIEISNYFAIELLFCIIMTLSNHIFMRGWIMEEKLFLFLSFSL